MPALPLTHEQKADAVRLKSLFQNWKEERRARGELGSQDAFSDLVGFGQSAVNQYLNGKIPLNPAAAAKFSRVLKCHISDFSETIAAQASEIAQATTLAGDEPKAEALQLDLTKLKPQEIQLVLAFRELGATDQSELLAMANKLRTGQQKSSGRTTPLDPSYAVPVKKTRRKRVESE
jgi:transcriptional regulator with XRE-family HTH domain